MTGLRQQVTDIFNYDNGMAVVNNPPFKVLITTSGVGERLGNLTKFTNKSLVKVGDKPAISYVVESYPSEVPIVITLGHFGNHVQDYLELIYPERKFEFVQVDKFRGPKTSLGYSMLQAKQHLQIPFIFHASDALVTGQPVPNPVKNWIGASKGDSSEHYSTLDAASGRVIRIHEKGNLNYDYLHIGLVGVFEYEKFWNQLRNLWQSDPIASNLSDVTVLREMLASNSEFEIHEFSNWSDIGNTSSLTRARAKYTKSHLVLEKEEESIFFVNNSVVKFYRDPEIVRGRVSRSKQLGDIVPQIIDSRDNFFKYEYQEGIAYSEVANDINFQKLLDWCNQYLWIRSNKLDVDTFEQTCREFYEEKTTKRIAKFFADSGYSDEAGMINGFEVPKVSQMLGMVDFTLLSRGIQSQFHGDLIMDNILQTKTGFKLVDWRQDFGGQISSGDLYYDLAKLNHSMVLNHDAIIQNLFTIEITHGDIQIDVFQKNSFVSLQQKLFKFIEEQGLDLKRVKLLTAIIWLNMSGLHSHPLNLFLFNLGKLNLFRAINEN